MIKKILPNFKGYTKYAFLAPLSVIIEVLLEIQIPLLMSKIVDEGITNHDFNLVVRTGALMILMALLSLLAGALSAKFSAKGAMGFGSNLRKTVFDRIQEFSFANIDKFSTASLVTRLTTDINTIQMAVMMVIRTFVRSPVMLVSATILAFRINSSLVRVFLVAIPVLAVTLITITVISFPRFQAMFKKIDNVNASVQENLIAIRVVKAFVRGAHEKLKFNKSNEELMQSAIKAEKTVILNMPIMQLTIYSCIVAILWFGGNMVITGGLQTGELISFISYVTQILMSLMMLSMVFVMLNMSRASISRLVEVLDEEIDIKDKDVPVCEPVKDGSISFENVSFRYRSESDTNTLEGINLEIRSGEMIGILGGTGSAKTSLVQLIPRLYDVNEGSVKVGGRDVRDYDLKTLRDAVSMVLQKNVLFSGSIRDNLKWGNQDATDEEIMEAARMADAHDFISSFPEGYDTDLGQGGVNVSGGQKQRLCIARALLKKPKIIILDDSTSAVDTATDARIRENLRNTLSDTTTIIIAQRITSVMDADRIIILDDGKIDAIGTHEELLAHNKIYQEVYRSQQEGVA